MKRVLSVFIALVIAFTTVAPGAVTVYAESSDAIVTDSNEIYEEQSEEESEEITNSASINSEGQEEQGTETSVEKPESENKLEETTQNQEYVSDRNHDQNSNSEYNEKEPASRPKEDDVIEVNEAETELVSQPAMNSLVEDAIVEGSDEGTGISWAISNTENGLTLTLASDSGELDTIPWDYDVLEQYFNQITCVEICSGVTTIGYNLLSGMESLSVVRLPDGLKEIRGYAFSNCSKISNIEIPNTVTTIGSYAFSDCEKLTDVSLSEGLISIENNAFYNCSSIAELIIPKTVTNLGGEFIAGTKIQTIEIPASVEYADSALSGAMYLDRVEFSDGTIKIPSNLFGTDPGKYNYVKEIRVPEGVTTIGSYAFYNLDQLKNVTLPASLSQIEYCAFAESSMLESVTFTENDTYVRTDHGLELYSLDIDGYVFQNCEKLQAIQFSKNIKSLGDEVFSGCTNLKTIVLPDELLRIGSRFIKGTGISEIVIPKNLAEVGGDVFGGAISLEKVQFAEGIKEIPYAMMASYSSVNYIKEIILPESLETIGADAFYGCKYLATVTIPQNVNTIGSQAFMGCTGLTSVLLTENDSIIRTDEGDELFSLRIEDNAFYGCSTLTEINLTQNVKYIGSHAFANTALSSIELPQYLNDIGQGFVSGTAIKSLTIPDSVVYAGQALDGATQLTSLTFADTMLNIPDYIGYNNESKSHLAEVTIPEGTLRIGDYAFANCLYISTIVIPASVAEIGEYSFENTNVVLYVVKNSYAEKWAIDHDIDYRYSSVEPSESSDQVLEISGCSYYTNSDVMSANRRIPMYIRYKVKKAERKGVSDMSISIRLSSALDLVSGSVLVDDELTSDYDVNDHIITIPVDAYEGSIQFIAKPVTAGKIASYANFNYYTNTGSKSEMVGSLSLNVPTLTLEAPSKTSVPAIDISGIAGAKEKINLYIDNSKVSTVTARNDGAYSTSVTIPGTPVNGKSYTIKAEQNSDTDIFTTAKVTYSENTPVLAAFELYYNEHSSQMIDLLASKGAAQTISYLPGTSLTFRILFENTDAIKRVFVGSRKGKETRKMEALPTGKTGEYIASGYFDENDHDYLPGSVYIMYETNAELTDTVGEIGIRNDEVLSDDWKDAEFNEEVSDSEAGNYSGSVTNKNGDTVTYDIQTMDPETAGEELIGPDTGTISSASDVISVLKDKVTADPDVDVISSDSDSLVYYQSDNAIHYVFTEDNGRKLVSEVIKGPGKTVVKELFKNVFGFSSAGADGVATGIAGVANAIYVGHNTYVDITRARDQINSNKNLTAAQRTAALEKLDRMEKANAALSAIRLINTGIKVGLTVTGHPVAAALFGVVSNMFESISQSYIDKAIEYAQDGIVYDLRWLIDPSGYVYEAVTDNYISGAKATAWFKETDDSEPIIWNAAEDGQQNPLYTDEAGRYAWDTPEGLWQVVIEKEGYETWKSEWLPVPPIQNNVNASLISTANPKVEWYQLTNGQLEIQFTQFMKPDSIAGIKIFDAAGKEISYSIEYDKSQTNEEGECLADYYQLKFTANSIKEGERATVSIPSSLENYHGTTIKADEFKVLRQIERSVTVMKSTSVDYGKQITVPVTVNNATEDTVVNAISSSAAIIKVVSVEHDEDNIWNIKLFGAMPGKTDVIVSLNNSMISDVIEVETVNKGTAEDVVEVQSINIEGGVETLKVGQTLQLSGKIIPDNATDKTIIWSSDNSNIALVGSDGTVTAIKEGEVIITARAMVGNATDQCRILIIEDKEDQKKNIESAEVIGIVDKTYTGSPLTQSFTVKMGSTTLAETDYTISYSNNINVGTATLIIEGVGDYTGSITKTFNINKPNAPSSQEGSDDQTTPSGNIQPQIKTNISTAVVYGITTKVYTGSALTQSPIVKVGSAVLKENTDFTFSYSNNINAGTATVRIIGKGKYTGVKTAVFTINKAANTLTVKANAVKIKAAKLKTKKQTIKAAKAFKIAGAQGNVTYKVKKYDNKAKKKIKVSKTGKITVKKGLKKGTYKIKVNVTAAGNANYMPLTKTVTVKIKIK